MIEGARELAERIHNAICGCRGIEETEYVCPAPVGELAEQISAVTASEVAAKDEEIRQLKERIFTLELRDRAARSIADRIEWEVENGILDSRSALADRCLDFRRPFSEQPVIEAEVARERERWRDTLQDLADEFSLYGTCQDECQHRFCVNRKRALCAANTLLDLMREVKS